MLAFGHNVHPERTEASIRNERSRERPGKLKLTQAQTVEQFKRVKGTFEPTSAFSPEKDRHAAVILGLAYVARRPRQHALIPASIDLAQRIRHLANSQVQPTLCSFPGRFVASLHVDIEGDLIDLGRDPASQHTRHVRPDRPMVMRDNHNRISVKLVHMQVQGTCRRSICATGASPVVRASVSSGSGCSQS